METHADKHNRRQSLLLMKVDLHLVCVDKEEDEENELCQEDDQQNDEKLKKKHELSKILFHVK